MSSLIQSINIRGGTVQQITERGLQLITLSLPIPGLQSQVQVTRTCDDLEQQDDVILDALWEAQMVLDSVQKKVLYCSD